MSPRRRQLIFNPLYGNHFDRLSLDIYGTYNIMYIHKLSRMYKNTTINRYSHILAKLSIHVISKKFKAPALGIHRGFSL